MLKLQLQKHQYLTLKSRLSARNSHSRKFESLILDLDSQFFKEYSHSQLSKICLRNLILNLDSQEFSPEFSFSISTLSQVTLAEVCWTNQFLAFTFRYKESYGYHANQHEKLILSPKECEQVCQPEVLPNKQVLYTYLNGQNRSYLRSTNGCP